MKDDDDCYVKKLLDLYLGLPQTPSRASRDDRRLAQQLCQQQTPLETPARDHFLRLYLSGCTTMQTAFRIVTRKGADSQCPALVFDLENRLHFPLTIFATEAVKRSSVSTARAYLNAILPFFS